MDDPNQLDNKGKRWVLKLKNVSFRTSLVVLIIVVVSGLLLTAYKINELNTRAFAVYLGNNEVGIVREKEEVSQLVDKIQKELSDKYNIHCIINKKLSFKDINAKDDDISTAKELTENIKSRLTFLVSGYALLIDGEEVGVLKKKEDVEEVINKFKGSFNKTNDENSEIKEIYILEELDIVKREVPLSKIKGPKEVLELIETGSEEIKTHIVEAGESIWTIANLYEMGVDEIMEANPDLDPEKVYPDDKIYLKVPKSLLTVETIEELNYLEDIDYEVKFEEDNSMYKTQKKVKTKGVQGKNEVIAKVVKHNGNIVSKEVIKEKVVEKPVNEIIVKGTREKPTTVATGTFLFPARGGISSGYGSRGGRMHKGIDISASVGTPIAAADGGTVTYVGYNGGYGNLVIINHSNGYVTKYAHCSKTYVNTGQRVHKGETIAAVGATGNASGAHLHFEVLKNGRHVNPSAYLGR